MTKTEELFHKIADSIPDAKKSKMFGCTCIKAPNGKAVLMIWKDDMVFKLTGKDEKDALALDGAHVFKPNESRPAMGGWIHVPLAHSAKWNGFAKKAFEYVKELKK